MKSTGELIERQQFIHHIEISWLNGLTFLSIIIKTSCRVWSRYDGRRRASVKQLILLMMSKKGKRTDIQDTQLITAVRLESPVAQSVSSK